MNNKRDMQGVEVNYVGGLGLIEDSLTQTIGDHLIAHGGHTIGLHRSVIDWTNAQCKYQMRVCFDQLPYSRPGDLTFPEVPHTYSATLTFKDRDDAGYFRLLFVTGDHRVQIASNTAPTKEQIEYVRQALGYVPRIQWSSESGAMWVWGISAQDALAARSLFEEAAQVHVRPNSEEDASQSFASPRFAKRHLTWMEISRVEMIEDTVNELCEQRRQILGDSLPDLPLDPGDSPERSSDTRAALASLISKFTKH